jgi:hypothetical protein
LNDRAGFSLELSRPCIFAEARNALGAAPLKVTSPP